MGMRDKFFLDKTIGLVHVLDALKAHLGHQAILDRLEESLDSSLRRKATPLDSVQLSKL